MGAKSAVEALAPGEFTELDGQIFLNAASYGPLPARARIAGERAFDRKARGRLGEHDFGGAAEAARTLTARLVNADPAEIALMPNTSVGLNLAADFALQRRAGGDDRATIVVSEGEFPANVYPWLELQRDGFRVERIPTDVLGRPDEAALFERVDQDDVALFPLSAVQFATGWRADLDRFGELCRRRDILFVVDAIQAVGAVPIDLGSAHVDVLACGGQKWLLSPHGTGFVRVRDELISRFRPPRPGWLSYRASQIFDTLLSYERDLLDDARRFEVGTLAMQDLAAYACALEVILGVGVERIHAHTQRLLEPLIDWAAERDIACTASDQPEHRSAIVALRPPDAATLFGHLTDARIQCAFREGAIRLAPHLYNSMEQIDYVIDVLDGMDLS